MAKNVKGFITCDGRFFENEQQADYEESLYVLSTTFDGSIYSVMPTAMLINFVEENHQIVLQHCKAFEAFKLREQTPTEIEMMQEGVTYNVSNTEPNILERTNETETSGGRFRRSNTDGNNGEKPNKGLSNLLNPRNP